jgi:hypothetical protein
MFLYNESNALEPGHREEALGALCKGKRVHGGAKEKERRFLRHERFARLYCKV